MNKTFVYEATVKTRIYLPELQSKTLNATLDNTLPNIRNIFVLLLETLHALKCVHRTSILSIPDIFELVFRDALFRVRDNSKLLVRRPASINWCANTNSFMKARTFFFHLSTGKLA